MDDAILELRLARLEKAAFGSVWAPEPVPPKTLYPAPGEVGVLDTSVLTPLAAPVITKDGTILDGFNITGSITIKANNVKIVNCLITAKSTASTSSYPIKVASSEYTGLVVESSTIDGNGRTSVVVGTKNFSLINCDVKGGADLIRADGNVLIEHCYLHGMVKMPGSHNDCVQMLKGSNVVIRNSRLEAFNAGETNNSCFIISAGTSGGPVSKILLQGNYFDGGNYTLYLGSGGTYPVTEVSVKNNVFSKRFNYGPVSAIADKAGFDLASNVFENGSPVK